MYPNLTGENLVIQDPFASYILSCFLKYIIFAIVKCSLLKIKCSKN